MANENLSNLVTTATTASAATTTAPSAATASATRGPTTRRAQFDSIRLPCRFERKEFGSNQRGGTKERCPKCDVIGRSKSSTDVIL
jgi:hypothetical protein